MHGRNHTSVCAHSHKYTQLHTTARTHARTHSPTHPHAHHGTQVHPDAEAIDSDEARKSTKLTPVHATLRIDTHTHTHNHARTHARAFAYRANG